MQNAGSSLCHVTVPNGMLQPLSSQEVGCHQQAWVVANNKHPNVLYCDVTIQKLLFKMCSFTSFILGSSLKEAIRICGDDSHVFY